MAFVSVKSCIPKNWPKKCILYQFSRYLIYFISYLGNKTDTAKKIKQRLSQIMTWPKGITEEQYAAFLSIVSLACRANHLLNGVKVTVDKVFNHS